MIVRTCAGHCVFVIGLWSFFGLPVFATRELQHPIPGLRLLGSSNFVCSGLLSGLLPITSRPSNFVVVR
jgi:hypothetical protein